MNQNNFINAEHMPRFVEIDGVWQNQNANPTGVAKIMCVGDLMGEPKMQEAAFKDNAFDFRDSFKFVKDVFKSSDLVLGNLETIVSNKYPFSMDRHKVEEIRNFTRYVCNSPLEYLDSLRYAGFDVLMMSNNHNLDYGIEGLVDTVSNVNKYGFGNTGAFESEEAKRYLMVNVNGIKLGVISYSTWFNEKENELAEDEQEIFINKYSVERVRKDIADAKKNGAEFILVYMHWGEESEYSHQVGAKQRKYAQEIVDSGADYIVGSHPHALQGYDIIKSFDGRNVPVAYSLSNFLTSDGNWITRKNVILSLTLQKTHKGVEIADECYIPCYVANSWNKSNYVIVPTVKELNGGFDRDFLKETDALALKIFNKKIKPYGGFKMSEKLSEKDLKEMEKLQGKISELHAGFGYTIAQWLYDHGFHTVSIVVNPKYENLIRPVILSLNMNDNVLIKRKFNVNRTNYNLSYHYDTQFKGDTFDPFDSSEIEPNDAVLYLSLYDGPQTKAAVESRGGIYFSLNELVNYSFYYIRAEEAIIKLMSETPGLHAVSYSMPVIERDESEHSKSILAKKIRYKHNVASLRSGNKDSDMLNDYIKEDQQYSIEEWLEMTAFPAKTYYDTNGFLFFEDRVGKHVNIVNGHRITKHQPDTYDNTIYFFGGCRTFGVYNSDEQTYPSQLQKLINNAGLEKTYRVENYGHFLFEHLIDMVRVISSIKPKAGDILIYTSHTDSNYKYEKFPHLDFSKMVLPTDYGRLFMDVQSHCTPNLNRFMAEKFLDFLVQNKCFEENKTTFSYKTRQIPICGLQRTSNKQNILPSEFSEKLEEYKNELRALQKKTNNQIGAIVVNCNPFTLGHRYLVEYAANRVKHLYIFVVQADFSEFAFADRFELVKKGTEDIENVTVLPSGEFIISALTFADYFQKSSIQDRAIDPSMDVELFAKEIAPTLGITVRFAGEEPKDNITNQYNDAMKRILPLYGVDFEVIQRREELGEVISASRVRKLLKDKDFEAISKLVPKSTLEYLLKNFGDKKNSLS